MKINKIKHMWRISLTFLLLGVCCQLRAQNVVFSAAPSANKIGIKDQIQVQYTVKDAQNLQSIAPGQSQDFTVVQGPFHSQSSNISIIGNQTVQSQSITVTYILQPKREGTFTIPPAIAKDAAGHTYQSNAMTIQVVSGSVAQQQQRRRRDPFGDDGDDPFAALLQQQQRMQQLQQQLHNQMLQQQNTQQQPSAQGQRQQPQLPQDPPIKDEDIKKDLFIKVVVDNNDVHVGEQITATYKLYSRLPMQINISKLPTLNGFWTQDFEIPRQPKPTEEIIDGKKFQVFVLKKSALFPQQTGTLELDPAEAKGMARVLQQVKRRMADMDPFGAGTLLMSDPFFNHSVFNATVYKDVPVSLKSTPVKIKVTALPDKNKPDNFSGAVGSFTIAGKLDKEELTTDDVATLTLNITGSGNIKIFEAPKLNLPNGLNTFDPLVTDTITGRSTTISGTKKINYSITPHTPGDYKIPVIPFTFFNPVTGNYVTVSTPEYKIHVKPGKHYQPSLQKDNNNLVINDLHDIIAKPLNNISYNSTPLLLSTGYWSLYALPLLAFIGLIIWKKRDDDLSKNSILLKNKRANKIALKRLVIANKLLLEKNKGAFYEEISKAIWLYLSDKINIPLSALSKETAMEALTIRKVPTEIQKNIESVIWECETALYASGGSNEMKNTYDEALKIISDLEDVIKA